MFFGRIQKAAQKQENRLYDRIGTDGGDRHGAGYENARAFRECDRASEERPDMSDECEEALYGLSQIQEKAAGWDDGSALVLAGPGAGKTRVLTKRVARLLQGSPDLHFKVLALTFTTKAAAEMRERVDTYVPGVAESRTFIGTFHAFCTQTLRQHGSHVNVFPDFGIYDQKREREALPRRCAPGSYRSRARVFDGGHCLVKWDR